MDFGSGFQKLTRVYGDVGSSLPLLLTVKGSDGRSIQLKNLGNHLLYKDSKPVKYGEYIHGFVMFAGDISLHYQENKIVKFTCIDVFGKRHTICAKKERFINMELLLEVLDVAAAH